MTQIMTHIVAGYPDPERCLHLAEAMAAAGAGLIEIQFPFSDPLADGPTIMHANQHALDHGMTPDACFNLAATLHSRISTPLYAMTYANIPLQMGLENFMTRCAAAGFSGVIIPDLPFDEMFGEYTAIAAQHGLQAIQVVSPGISHERLQRIAAVASGFIYATLRIGITGSQAALAPAAIDFLKRLRAACTLPLAAGFGISSPEQARTLQGHADIVVIGSHILNLYNDHGQVSVSQFLRALTSL